MINLLSYNSRDMRPESVEAPVTSKELWVIFSISNAGFLTSHLFWKAAVTLLERR